MQIETLAELLAYDKKNDWLGAQSSNDLERLVDVLIDMDLAADPKELSDLQEEYDTNADEERESRDALETVRDLLTSGRVDDAMLLIERTLWPRRQLPMRQEQAA